MAKHNGNDALARLEAFKNGTLLYTAKSARGLMTPGKPSKRRGEKRGVRGKPIAAAIAQKGIPMEEKSPPKTKASPPRRAQSGTVVQETAPVGAESVPAPLQPAQPVKSPLARAVLFARTLCLQGSDPRRAVTRAAVAYGVPPKELAEVLREYV